MQSTKNNHGDTKKSEIHREMVTQKQIQEISYKTPEFARLAKY